MTSWRQFLLATAVVSVACAASAQSETLVQNSISTGPDTAILTTHDTPAATVKPALTVPIKPVETGVAPSAPAAYSQKNPFGRGEAGKMPPAPVIPSEPHSTVAVPVVDVDELEAAEPAPPEPTAPGADPVQEDPAEPTDLTSPIFEEEVGAPSPRTIVIRALNKVTAQSELLRLKPNETAQFGQIEITAVTCRVSSPTSQTDYAALLDIAEKVVGKDEVKPLFRGWMYASSPSITSLEHSVYDVTMVECAVMPKKEEKSADEKPAKDAATAKEPSAKPTSPAKTVAPAKDAGKDSKKAKH